MWIHENTKKFWHKKLMWASRRQFFNKSRETSLLCGSTPLWKRVAGGVWEPVTELLSFLTLCWKQERNMRTGVVKINMQILVGCPSRVGKGNFLQKIESDATLGTSQGCCVFPKEIMWTKREQNAGVWEPRPHLPLPNLTSIRSYLKTYRKHLLKAIF